MILTPQFLLVPRVFRAGSGVLMNSISLSGAFLFPRVVGMFLFSNFSSFRGCRSYSFRGVKDLVKSRGVGKIRKEEFFDENKSVSS
jgi:hypothetical protein